MYGSREKETNENKKGVLTTAQTRQLIAANNILFIIIMCLFIFVKALLCIDISFYWKLWAHQFYIQIYLIFVSIFIE